MLKVMLFLLIIIIFSIIDLKPAFKQKNYKLAVIYISISTICLAICILTEFHVKIPGPSKPIKNVVDALLGR
jgi:low temperature requirement protein LtrA